MMKKNFLHRNAPAYKPKSMVTGLFAVCLCLLVSSCDKNFIPSDDDGTSVALQFSTSIDNRGESSGSNEIVGGIVRGTEFPDGTHDIGVFLKSAAGTEVSAGTGDNMKAVLARSGATNSWTYANKNNGTISALPSHIGKNLQVIAYYPYWSGATATAVPFDFTDANLVNQKELLYNKPSNQTLKVVDGGRIPLAFAHAYSLINLKISKSVDAGTIVLQSVGIINQSGEWIKNKGSINPATGYPNEGAQAGSLVKGDLSAVLNTEGTEYSFLVPAFMDKDITDDQIAFKVMVSGKESVFSLKKNHLNQDNSGSKTLYGFAQGTENTYILVYDNLSLSLQIRGWTSVTPEGNIGQPSIPQEGYMKWLVKHTDIKSDLLSSITKTNTITNHLYETYLLDIDRGNNGTGKTSWDSKELSSVVNFESYTWYWEAPRAPLMFALNDASPESVQWRDNDGVMVAKQLCRNYREGGYTNWRLPRMSEWYMLNLRILSDKEKNYEFFYSPSYITGGKVLGAYDYWSGTEALVKNSGTAGQHTEVDVVTATINKSSFVMLGKTLSYASKARVRCVRDN